MDREQILEEVLQFLKTLTPEERGEFLAVVTEMSLKITLEECMSEITKEIFKKDEEKVA